MANYQELKNAVAAVIKTNGNQEITGQILQNVLLSVISNIGENATYIGVATPTTNPGTPDANVFYIANENGNYVNFGLEISLPGLYTIRNTTTGWQKTLIFDMGAVSYYPFSKETIVKDELQYKVVEAIKDILIVSDEAINKRLKVYVYDRLTSNAVWFADENNTTIWRVPIPTDATGLQILSYENENGLIKVKVDLDITPFGTTYMNGANNVWIDTAALWSEVDKWTKSEVENNWSDVKEGVVYSDNDLLALNAIKSIRLYNYGSGISDMPKALKEIRNVAGDYYIEFDYYKNSWIYLIRYSSTTKPSGNIKVPLLYNNEEPTGQYMAEMIVDFSKLPESFTWVSPNLNTVSKVKDDLTIIDNYAMGTGKDVMPISQWSLSAMIQNPSVEIVSEKVRYSAGHNLPLFAAFAIKEFIIVSEPEEEKETNYNVWVFITGGTYPYKIEIADDENNVLGQKTLANGSSEISSVPKKFDMDLINGARLSMYINWDELPDKTVIVNGGCGIRANKGYRKVFTENEIRSIANNEVLDVVGNNNGYSTNYSIYENVSMYVPNLWGYNPGHNAETDIQNGVMTVSNGVFHNPIVTKLSRYDGMTNTVWRQYFNMKNSAGIGSIVNDLLQLQQMDLGEMIPALAKATFYNPGDVSFTVNLGILFRYDDGSYEIMNSGNETILPRSSKVLTASFTPGNGKTWENVTIIEGYSNTGSVNAPEETPIWLEVGDMDFYFIDPKNRVTRPFILPENIKPGINEEQLSLALQDKINNATQSKKTIDKNLRISCAGSSVTWGTGFLQDSMLKYLIPKLQKERTNFVSPNDVSIKNGTYQIKNTVNDKLLFGNLAVQVNGENATIEFQIEGNEISIVQAILRDNTAASVIDVYIDGVLYDTISNYNEMPLGHETKQFDAVDNQKEFPIGKPFTYNHIVKVNGVQQEVTLNKGTTMPESGWAVARDIQKIDDKFIVQHTLFSPTPLSEGDVVTCEYDFGREITYEKTTIGKDGNGVLESAYGRGYTPFDPANPGTAAFGSGLDFRQTDESIIKKYTFENSATRSVKLQIRGLDSRATGAGTPYFIFNFATSRILYFQNAGIGGWASSRFNDENQSDSNVLRTWREIVDFQPDYIFYESTPNDDWGVGGYKLYTSYPNLTLEQLQKIRTMPNKNIKYQSESDNYLYEQWYGKIAEITSMTVKISEDTNIDTEPSPGDSVVVGSYYSDNKQQVARLVRSYDAISKTITFDRPINKRDFSYPDISYFVGKGIQVRDLSIYSTQTTQLLEKLKGYGNMPLIGLVPNPAPNMKSRDLTAYQPYLDKLSNENEYADFYVGLWNVYDWQYSQVRDGEITVAANTLVQNDDGTKSVDLNITKGNNYMNYQVLVNGVDVTNRDAVVFTAYALGVNRDLSGSALDDTQTRGKQVWGNFYPTLIFFENAPTDGDIVVKYSTKLWSGDSCHVNVNSQQLFAIGYSIFID